LKYSVILNKKGVRGWEGREREERERRKEKKNKKTNTKTLARSLVDW
jgi:hypothetical protein